MDCQRVKFERPISGHTLEMAKMFACFSNINTVNDMLREYPLDIRTQEMVKLIEHGAKQLFVHNYTNEEPELEPKMFGDENIKHCIVCFSGGKDSTAAALTMREKGYDVQLYYVQGINKSYPNELQVATNIARWLGMQLIVEKVTLVGKTTFHDNPVKNQLIASMALDYGLESGFSTTIVFGDFTEDNIYNSSFLEAWSDTQEMWSAHNTFVRQYVPSYKIVIPFKNYLETMDVMEIEPALMQMVQGCVLPHRFRENAKKNNEKKYNVSLLPNRCGSCWKCCVEYIHYADKGVVPYNTAFYLHCLNFLADKMDVLHPNIKDRSIESVYKAFLFDDFKTSKYYENECR